MNSTDTSVYHGTIYDFVGIAETTFNMLMIVYMHYKLKHFTLDLGQGYCFGKKCCPECHIVIDESDSGSK